MNKDLKIYMDDYKFKVRVAGIIIENNHVLVESYDGFDVFTLPGGHVTISETTKKAVKRELEEEIGKKVVIDKLLCIMENFYINNKGENTHCLDFFYLANFERKVDDLNNFSSDEIDHGVHMHHDYKWLSIDELDKYDLKPNGIIKIIRDKKYDNVFHMIQKDI